MRVGPVRQLPAATISTVLMQIAGQAGSTIVNAHMTVAKAAAAARVTRRPPVVVTRHFAALRRCMELIRLGARIIRAWLTLEISISRFVADSIGNSFTVFLDCVPAAHHTMAADLRFLMAQRIEPEKQTDVGIETRARCSLRPQESRVVVASGVPVEAARGGARTEKVGIVSYRRLFSDGDAAAAASMPDALGHDPEAREDNGGQLRAVNRQRLSDDIHVDCLETIYGEVAR